MTEEFVIEIEQITDYRQLSPGDHIATFREKFTVAYSHHGIFVGGNVGVIHFEGENKRNATVKAGDLKSFCKGNKLYKVRYLNVKPRDPKDVIKVAERLRNNPAVWGEYNLLSHNCEHFATYCKYGKAVSVQLEEKIRRFLENAKRKFAVFSAVATLLSETSATVASLNMPSKGISRSITHLY